MKPMTFEKVWETYKVRNKAKKTRMATAASVLVLSMAIAFTPAAQAAIQSWFEVTFIKNAKNASYGYTLPNSAGDASMSASTKSEAEKLAGRKLAFPNEFLTMEDGALNKEYIVEKKRGDFIGYSYSLRTNERMIQVNASFKQHTKPQMWAETTKDAMVKERDVDGSKVHILSISEFDGAAAYYEKDDWVIVISAIASGVNEHEAAPFSEEEMVNYIKSIEFR
ncbi:hypothetical protein HQN89_36790 [Paenibacillus frigoriresistens]|uniref:hypothetical protein n=1 Tax=Paenibacillus alginolyticus TaxID=59839 RepID=UPI0015662A38|nr:hypothetical protein [Paenibacillus frigoriresistens]NRF96311.1 hypothetical protein [Paenibacillus frigoriresistens]